MKEYIDKLSLGSCEFENPVIATSVASIEENLYADRMCAGEFLISTQMIRP